MVLCHVCKICCSKYKERGQNRITNANRNIRQISNPTEQLPRQSIISLPPSYSAVLRSISDDSLPSYERVINEIL
ncbi:unnamed protein product [Rotaria sp. Silwood1]|nr:unnamed protein product [Rotaria sp. Silwood1]